MPINTSRILRWLVTGVVVIIVLFVLYTWVSLHWSYSQGERAGYVQKFSSKGWIFKTWEGELAMVSMPGTNPEKFYFSVRDDSVATAINRSLGERVVLGYESRGLRAFPILHTYQTRIPKEAPPACFAARHHSTYP
jgi:lysophospholipid acyltransferase (LPLAT)-like uncharacterized protein